MVKTNSLLTSPPVVEVNGSGTRVPAEPGLPGGPGLPVFPFKPGGPSEPLFP